MLDDVMLCMNLWRNKITLFAMFFFLPAWNEVFGFEFFKPKLYNIQAKRKKYQYFRDYSTEEISYFENQEENQERKGNMIKKNVKVSFCSTLFPPQLWESKKKSKMKSFLLFNDGLNVFLYYILPSLWDNIEGLFFFCYFLITMPFLEHYDFFRFFSSGIYADLFLKRIIIFTCLHIFDNFSLFIPQFTFIFGKYKTWNFLATLKLETNFLYTDNFTYRFIVDFITKEIKNEDFLKNIFPDGNTCPICLGKLNKKENIFVTHNNVQIKKKTGQIEETINYNISENFDSLQNTDFKNQQNGNDVYSIFNKAHCLCVICISNWLNQEKKICPTCKKEVNINNNDISGRLVKYSKEKEKEKRANQSSESNQAMSTDKKTTLCRLIFINHEDESKLGINEDIFSTKNYNESEDFGFGYFFFSQLCLDLSCRYDFWVVSSEVNNNFNSYVELIPLRLGIEYIKMPEGFFMNPFLGVGGVTVSLFNSITVSLLFLRRSLFNKKFHPFANRNMLDFSVSIYWSFLEAFL